VHHFFYVLLQESGAATHAPEKQNKSEKQHVFCSAPFVKATSEKETHTSKYIPEHIKIKKSSCYYDPCNRPLIRLQTGVSLNCGYVPVTISGHG
jgi:hypothetical protein